MKGPTAPKDPEKRRPFFYIIRDKEVFGAKTQINKQCKDCGKYYR